MTSFNRENFLAEAVNSVLASTFTNFELIIVDDCSTDTTVAIARQFEAKDQRVKVFINEKNLTDYPNRNKAASLASGKYIKYVDSDDILYPHCLQVMVHAMEQFPDAGYGLSCLPDIKEPFPLCISPHQAYREHFFERSHFDRAPGSAIINKKAFESVGGFSGQRMIGDFELWLKIGQIHPLVKFPVDLYWSRHHSGQESKSDYAKKYSELTMLAIETAFANKDCPLSEIEKDEARKRINRKKKKVKVIKIINKIFG